MDSLVERALMSSGVVEACAVRRRRFDAGDLLVAYVVPRPGTPFSASDLRRRVAESAAAAELPEAYVELRRLPLDSDGRVDEAALDAVPVVDDTVLRHADAALLGLPGVREAAAIVEDRPAAPLPLHLSDLLPGWNGGADDGSETSAQSSPEDLDTSSRPWSFADGGPLTMPPGAPATLVDGLLRTAAERGHRVIRLVQTDGSERQLSYADLLTAARRTLTGLRRIGMQPGDMAILQVPELDEHFPTFWACLLGGIKPVTVAVPTAYDAKNAVVRKLFNTWTLLGRPRILAARGLVEPIRALRHELDMADALVVPVDELRDDEPAAAHHPSRPEDVAFFQLSSGSTGVSKCIQITHGGVVHHIHASQQHLGLSPDDVTLNWLPMDHVVPLLMYHTKDVYLGIEAVQVPGPVVLADPLKWLDYIEAYKVTHSWAPNFGFKMVADALAAARDRRWDLSSMKGWVNAGEQVTQPVARDFLERVGPFGVAPAVLQPAFGMAEACTCMTYEFFDAGRSVHRMVKASASGVLVPAAPDQPATAFVDCGPVVRGVQIRIADKANAVVREGTIGRLQIKGPVVTPGYLNNPAANDEAFVGDGWFNSGDLGFMWNGHLTLTGREKELIIVNGANFYCYEIEDVASGLPGVMPTFTAACGVADPATGTEALAFFFVHDASAAPSLVDVVKRVRTEIAASTGLSPAFVVPVARDEFPKTTSGKIQRNQLKQWLLDGRFRATLKALDLQLENANTLPSWFYQATWRAKPVQGPLLDAPAGVRVIFADRAGIGDALASRWRAEGARTILVDSSGPQEHAQPDRFALSPAGDHRALVRAIVQAAGPVGLAVHLWTCDAEADAAGSIGTAFDRGSLSVLALLQALASEQPGRKTAIVVGTMAASRVAGGDMVVPAHATLPALVKTAVVELDWLQASVVDVAAASPTLAAAAIADEVTHGLPDREVAWRDGRRLVRVLAPVDLAGMPTSTPLFRRGGAYLLTGGFGGVGTEVARDLLKRHHAKLLIVGRRPIADDRAPVAADERVAALRELRTLPGDVRYAVADVTDAAALAAAVAAAEAEWGAPLDGVVHMAGVFAEHPLLEETRETFLATLAPKAAGAVALHRLVADRPGTVFLSFSSAYGFLGGFGSGAYSCANAFLDGFSAWQAAVSGLRARAVAWSIWNDTGMGRGYSNEAAARARGFRLMSRRHALLSLAAVESHDVPHVLVGLDPDGRGARALVESGDVAAQRVVGCCVMAPGAAFDAARTPQVRDRLGRPIAVTMRQVPSMPRTATGEVDRRALAQGRVESAARVTPRSEIERVVASVWQETLQQDGLGIHDNFFELGGTSFMAAQIAGRLRAKLQTDMVSTQMFQFPTIAAQAAFLTGEHEPSEALATSQSRGASRREAARLRRGTARPAGGR